MRRISVSAPGKLHLLGEHAVVHGKPALLAAINKRLFITLMSSNKRQINGAGEFKKKIEHLVKILEEKIKLEKKIKDIEPYTINIDSQFPIGSGLGSSAALSAAITGALFNFLDIRWDKKEIFEIAYEGEKFFHGNPSGGDLAVIIEGGLVWFRKEFGSLKFFKKLDIHKKFRKFFIVDSGKPKESTKEMIDKVAAFNKSSQEQVESIFNSQENLTKQLAEAFIHGDENNLILCITEGENNLEKLRVVGKKAKTLIANIKNAGGVAKISGAGGFKDGSGAIIAYFRNKNKLKNLIKSHGYRFEEISIDREGLKTEK